jgi:hypothetical protein
MTTTIMTRHEIDHLADRLQSRGSSLVFKEMPEMQNDLRLAARIIRTLVREQSGTVEIY